MREKMAQQRARVALVRHSLAAARQHGHNLYYTDAASKDIDTLMSALDLAMDKIIVIDGVMQKIRRKK